MLGYPLGVGLENPPICEPGDPQVWAWRPPGCGPGDPPGVGLETPLGHTPELPPWVWAWRPTRHAGIPPPRRYLQGMLGYHLKCMLGYHTPPPQLWTEFLTHASENITLPQTLFVGGKKDCHQRWPHRFHVSCSRTWVLDPLLNVVSNLIWMQPVSMVSCHTCCPF